MAKNLNEEYRVSMKFDADTKAAQQQIERLFNTLNKISTSAPKTFNLNEFQKAAEAAENLKRHLNAAVNVDTGKLDLSKFSQSLNKSHQDLNDIYKSLTAIGPEGSKAFMQLATSITNADNSTFTLNKKIKELGTTLRNTIKWQISSSMIHGFMGAIQSAYGYAQDLNKSLNNIRIVTGQNIDQMEKFAVTANKAAKALSTSTLNYTDAALIYYQQGLSDQEVKARTDVTVKMANVTGDTAEKVSQQLTAVWNNFAKGSDNLEYFADVMTALGAATASSTDEISEGLEKFSAVAQTVGLSYEYATAALATVTATTRESASVVGNAFKTLFARLEGLKLGETLDDGTDLNKYSQALATIGVNIKDASGQLRNMDDILDDMAKKWNTLSKDSQMATAQTVGGVRQYNTLIALMNNWDFMQENLKTARNASGELQKQADIYAESWEAAQKRVKASLESIYTTIIDDKAFIGLTDTLAGVVNVIGNVIEGLGGVKGLLLLIGSIVMDTYAKEFPRILSNLGANIAVLTGHANTTKAKLLQDMNGPLDQALKDSSGDPVMQAQVEGQKKINSMVADLTIKRKTLSQEEIASYEREIERTKLLAQQRVELVHQLEEMKKQEQNNGSLLLNSKELLKADKEKAIEATNRVKAIQQEIKSENQVLDTYKQQAQSLQNKKQLLLDEYNNSRKGNQTQASSYEEMVARHNRAPVGMQSSSWQEKHAIYEQIADEEQELVIDQAAQIDNIDRLNDKLKDLQQQEKDAIDTFKQHSNQSAQYWKDQKKAAQQASETLGQLVKSQHTFQSLLRDPKVQTAGVISSSDKQALEEYLQKLREAGNITPEEFNKMKTALEGNNATWEEFRNIVRNSVSSLETDITKQYQYMHDTFQAEYNDLDRVSEGYERYAQAQEDSIQNSLRFRQSSQIVQSQVMNTATALGYMTSTLMSLSFSINALKNLGNIWNDKDTTTGEKILQTMTALGTVLPTVIALINKEKIGQLGGAAAKLLGIQATVEMTNAEGKSIPVKIASGNAGYYALGPLLAFVAIAGAVVVAIIAITKALKERYGPTLQENKELLEDINSALEDNKNKYNELKNSLESYNESKSALVKMKENTEEFTNALENANEKAQYLINTLGLSFGKDFNIENGLITFTESGLQSYDEKTQQLLEQQSNLTAASNAISNRTREQEIDKENTLIQQARVNQEADEYSRLTSDYRVATTSALNEALAAFRLIDDGTQDTVIKALQDQGYHISEGQKAKIASQFWDYLDASPGERNNFAQILANSLNEGIVSELPPLLLKTAIPDWSNTQLEVIKNLSASQNPFASLIVEQETQNERYEEIKNGLTSDITQLKAFLASPSGLGQTIDEINETYGNDIDKLQRAVAGIYFKNEIQDNAELRLNNISNNLNNLSQQEQTTYTNLALGNFNQLSPKEIEYLKQQLAGPNRKQVYDFVSSVQGSGKETAQIIGEIYRYNPIPYFKEQLQTINSIQENIKELNKAFGSLKFGDTVDSIEGLSEEAASYFTIMADGTYKLTGSAEEFQKALLNQQRAQLLGNIEKAKEALGTAGISEEDSTYFNSQISQNQYAIAMTATDVEDLNQLLHDEKIGLDHYTAAWSLLEQERDLKGLDTKQLSNYIDYLEEAEHMSEEVADTVARSAMKMAKGTDALSKNFETWSKALTTSEERSQEYYESLTGLREAIADLLDISEDHLSESFLRNADNMKLMQQAAEGDKEAIESLRTKLSNNLFENYTELVDFSQFDKGFRQQLIENYESAQKEIQNNPVGASLDLTDYISQLNEMIAMGQLTVDQVNGMLDAMGVDAQYEVQEVDLPQTVTHTTKTQRVKEISGPNSPVKAYEITETSTTNTQTVPGGSISIPGVSYGKGKKPQITGVIKKANSSYAPSINSKSGKGGGSKSGSQKKNSDVERYHEVKSTLKDLESEYGRIGKARERAFGPGQLKLYDQELEKLNEIIEADRRYLAEARGWMDVDIENANKVASLFGFETFNDQTNWTEIQYKLNDFYNDALASGDEEAQKLYDTYSDYIQKAIDTHGVILEREEAWIDHMNERQDKLYEKWSKEIDLKVDLDERNLKLIDLKLKQLGDSFYKRVEAAWLLLQKIGLASNENIDISKALEDQNFLQGKFDEVAGLNLSPDQQYQAYSLIMDKAIDAANALLDLREQMMSYYADSISQMREEWNNADTQFTHLTTTLDHYDKLLDLTGQGKDYDKRLAILQGQLKVSKDQLNVHKEELSILEEEERRRAQDLQDALSTNNEYAINFAKKNLEVAKENVRELTEVVQQDIEKIAETAQTVLTTSLEQIYKEYEKRLTNGVGYDYLNQIMDLQADKADLVLTQTNQIYETNKMLRDLDRDIEKTENTAAKARLNSFRQEIKALQEKGELTHFELEDAQLRYEVLKAQIALEEAQNAKSTVRLQRDSEGNFGYVYTADREKVAEAEDNFEKANNDRYNHALEAQEKFLRQYYEVQKRYQDDLTALDEQRIAGAISEEEYWTRRQEITNLYAPLLETLEKNHLDAIGVMNETAAAHTNDSWTQALIGQGYGLQGKTEQWRNESVKLVGEVEGSFNQWKTTIDEVVEPAVTGDLNDMRDAVEEVTTKSKALKDYVISDVLPAQKQELDRLDELITDYLSIQDRIDELIRKYQELATKACEAIGKIGAQILELPNEKIIPVITQDRNATTGDSNGDASQSTNPDRSSLKIITGYKAVGWVDNFPEYNMESYAKTTTLANIALKTYKKAHQDPAIASHVHGNVLAIYDDGTSEILKEYSFASGGYTGEWGPAGKLAVLHQKELVLNADDTKNFLAGMSILRNITSMIDLQAAAMGAMDAYSNLAVPGVSRSLDQNVTIHAEFPNVTQHNEIELAFADLINRASQYANRY